MSYPNTSIFPDSPITVSPIPLMGKLVVWIDAEGLGEGIIREIVEDGSGYVIVETMDKERLAVK